jgi:hypothetical protein
MISYSSWAIVSLCFVDSSASAARKRKRMRRLKSSYGIRFETREKAICSLPIGHWMPIVASSMSTDFCRVVRCGNADDGVSRKPPSHCTFATCGIHRHRSSANALVSAAMHSQPLFAAGIYNPIRRMNIRSNPSRRRCGTTASSAVLPQLRQWLVACCAALALMTMQLPAASAFSVMMMSSPLSSSDKYSYQPPVKTSVEQLQKFSRPNKRFAGSSGSPSGNGGGSSGSGGSTDRSTAHAAMAGGAALSMPPMVGRSFEERMRDLVLGPTTTANSGKQTKWETHRTTTTRGSVLPPNVQLIESLQDYKRVVGDEREKIVAVRFYANYCKVRYSSRARDKCGWTLASVSFSCS